MNLLIFPSVILIITPVEILIFLLLTFHIYLYWNNLTTYEFVKKREK